MCLSEWSPNVPTHIAEFVTVGFVKDSVTTHIGELHANGLRIIHQFSNLFVDFLIHKQVDGVNDDVVDRFRFGLKPTNIRYL